MAARRYEISLRCAHSGNIFQHEKRNFVSPSEHVIFCLLYKYHSAIVSTLTKAPLRKRESLGNHNNGDLFTCEDLKFSRERFPGISLVFI